MAGRDQRSSNREVGTRAEQAVAAHLVAAGLEIVGLNLRIGRLELDVVARDGAVIAVVEVRTRGPGAWVRPLDSVDAEKQRRVRRAGERLWRDRFMARRAEVVALYDERFCRMWEFYLALCEVASDTVRTSSFKCSSRNVSTQCPSRAMPW